MNVGGTPKDDTEEYGYSPEIWNQVKELWGVLIDIIRDNEP